MSILEGKTVLIATDEKEGVLDLENVLKRNGMKVEFSDCNSALLSSFGDGSIDLVIVNHLHDKNACIKLLSQLRQAMILKNLPVFVVIENSLESIKETLLLGATDYLTVDESTESVVKKIKIAFGQPDNFSSTSVIDVPPDVALTTKKGIRVYIVEDDPLLRNLLSTRLEASSFPSDFSIDGANVVQKIIDYKPQVIILDLMLPVKNGFEILEELKKNPESKHIPVIVFSNRDSQDDKKRIFDLGADRFFVKAMTDLSVLVETIEELAG